MQAEIRSFTGTTWAGYFGAQSLLPVSAIPAISHLPPMCTRLKRSVPQWSGWPSTRNTKGAQTTAVVIDPNQRVVNAFLDAAVAGFGDVIGERFDGHLLRLAFPHQYEHCAWQGRGLDGIGVSMRHPGKQCIDGGEDGGVLRVYLRRGKHESQCDGSRNESRGFHGA